ncbi:Hpt domain-containing protein [Pedobacter sp. UBA5917]|jgi:HPt (histidine-containing phosphotransfer) domain-containing protein|uniref:Hpt domain-containing protein n=1 Tax=Pedobacter sp. UBA5917 TaxID=1947061 RepID=UPI0025D5E924|nr:Hpt domain-containing protein [Pedobacter sp. UBA5917]
MPHSFYKRPLDFSYLIDMVGDEPAFLIELIDTFLVQIPVFITEMDKALMSENWVKISQLAHKIKPTFSYIGRNDIKDLLHQIENPAKNELLIKQMPTEVEKLKFVLADVLLQLEQEKVKLGASL